MTAPARWEPDTQLVDAVLSAPRASRGMTQLPEADRAWLVAGLTAAGLTAKDIAERLDCSLRLVRSIRAEPMTQMCEFMLQAEKNLGDELRNERIDKMALRCDLGQARREIDRLRRQLDQMVDALQANTLEAFPRCGHPRVKYNVYSWDGREHCRECRRKNQAEYRARRKPPTCEVIQPDAYYADVT